MSAPEILRPDFAAPDFASPDFFSVAPRPCDEAARQAALDGLAILDTAVDPAFDAIVQRAAARFGTAIAAISLVDRDRQWFKAIVGLDATETPRAYSFCAHAPHERDGVLVVPDAGRDRRFQGNPLVTGAPHIRFYAGAVLVSAEGQPLGALCVIDPDPRPDLSAEEREDLRAMARDVIAALYARG